MELHAPCPQTGVHRHVRVGGGAGVSASLSSGTRCRVAVTTCLHILTDGRPPKAPCHARALDTAPLSPRWLCRRPIPSLFYSVSLLLTTYYLPCIQCVALPNTWKSLGESAVMFLLLRHAASKTHAILQPSDAPCTGGLLGLVNVHTCPKSMWGLGFGLGFRFGFQMGFSTGL